MVCRAFAADGLLLLVASLLCTPAFTQSELQREAAFITQTKTGTVFGTTVMKCVVPRLHDQEEQEWIDTFRSMSPGSPTKRGFLLPDTFGSMTKGVAIKGAFLLSVSRRIVYMVRNPYEAVRSHYFYRMECTKTRPRCLQTEIVMLRPATKVIGSTTLLREKPLPNETYNSYLHRVSMSDGIIATMAGDAVRMLRQMNEFYPVAVREEKVLVVCLGDSFRAYERTVQMILQHLGLAPNAEQWRCLVDNSTATATKGMAFAHSTHRVAPERRQAAMRLIEEYDARYFGGQYGSSPIASLCGREGLS